MPAIDHPKLDAREAHFRLPSHHAGLSLFLRYLAPVGPTPDHRVVLYVRGATFPSALSIAHRFDGRSWRDELVACGFHTWALDPHGFGVFSDRYPEMGEPAKDHPPLGRALDASRQLEGAARFICAHHQVSRLSIIAHSWGTIVAGDFAERCPALVDRALRPTNGRRNRSRLANCAIAMSASSVTMEWPIGVKRRSIIRRCECPQRKDELSSKASAGLFGILSRCCDQNSRPCPPSSRPRGGS